MKTEYVIHMAQNIEEILESVEGRTCQKTGLESA